MPNQAPTQTSIQKSRRGSALTSADGVLVVDKPAGWTSHDVVGRVRRLAGTRKVGHAGTLDPMATGVLVLGLGRATRLLGHLAATRKTYAATARLGVRTVTDDADGAVVERTPTGDLDAASVRAAAATLVGDIEQVPSAVSAIKVDGQRAYARVRRGETVELAARAVTVYDLHVSDVRPGMDHVDVAFVVECSSGTYVRALARDLGRLLGVGGHLTELRRTSVGPFCIAQASSLDECANLVAAGESLPLLDLAAVARAVFPTIVCDAGQAVAVSHGRPIDLSSQQRGGADESADARRLVALVDEQEHLPALYRSGGSAARAEVVFRPA
jgi:tRNA pseudouridine55 synthase